MTSDDEMDKATGGSSRPTPAQAVMEYARTTDGKLKILEMILCFCGTISAMVPSIIFTPSGGPAVYTATITSMTAAILVFCFNTCLAHRRPRNFFFDAFVIYAFCSLFLFVTGILAAAVASQLYAVYGFLSLFGAPTYNMEAVAACAFFVLTACPVFIYDTYKTRQIYKSSLAVEQTP